MVKAWDLKEFVCLQTISIRFPTTLGGKIPSFGPFPADLYLNASLGQVETSLPGGLVLACNDYLCLMKLGQETARDGSLTETHASPVSCAVYNSRLKQVKRYFSDLFKNKSNLLPILTYFLPQI